MGDAFNAPRENITGMWLVWESEGFVVAWKPGNAGGAKGPCRERVDTIRREYRLEEIPTTEPKATRPSDNQPPDEPETRSGVKFIPDVSRLRWKLSRKAKQEPKFRFYAVYDRIYRSDVLAVAMRHLRRRSQRPFRPPEGVSFYTHLQALGLELL